MDRKEYLLKQVLKLFKQQKESPYVLYIERMKVVYDGAECDGSCLCDDIMAELNIDDLDELEDEEVEDDNRPSCCKDHNKYFAVCDTCEYA